MRKRISPTLFALLLAAGPAFAQFEGVLEMNMTFGPTEMKMVMLQKNDTPDMLYRINDADKTYTEIDMAKMRQMAGQQKKASEYTVEKLGQETLLGYKTQHVLVKEKNAANGNGMNMEMWTAKDLLDYATFSKLQARPDRGGREEIG